MSSKTTENIGRANVLLGLQFLSDFGDQITTALLALYLLEITKSTSLIGFVYFSSTVGFVVFTLLGGLIGDRLSKRNILVFSDLGRGFLVLLLIIAFYQKSMGLVYVISFLLAVLSSLCKPVKLGLWAQSIPSQKLESYNSLSELSLQMSMILGPLIASFFDIRNIEFIGFTLDSMTFLICGAVFWSIFRNFEKDKTEEPQKKKRDLLRGFKIIAHQFEMKKMIAYDAIQMIGFGAFNATFLVLAQRDFGWSKAQYSYHLSILAGFTIVGALLGSSRFVVGINQKFKLISCALISAVCLAAMLKFEAFPVCSILFGICDGLAVFTIATTRTAVQLVAKREYPQDLTSIIAARSILIKLATLAGTSACLLIEDYMSLKSTLLLFTIPIGLSCLTCILPSHTEADPIGEMC